MASKPLYELIPKRGERVMPFFGHRPTLGPLLPVGYLSTPPMVVRQFTCRAPVHCTYPGRHSCGMQTVGRDPGDEDKRP